MAGIFGDFFVVSVSQETKHEKSWKILETIRRKIPEKNSERKFQKFGDFSFCTLPNLKIVET